jgi:hypothetical protein
MPTSANEFAGIAKRLPDCDEGLDPPVEIVFGPDIRAGLALADPPWGPADALVQLTQPLPWVLVAPSPLACACPEPGPVSFAGAGVAVLTGNEGRGMGGDAAHAAAGASSAALPRTTKTTEALPTDRCAVLNSHLRYLMLSTSHSVRQT